MNDAFSIFILYMNNDTEALLIFEKFWELNLQNLIIWITTTMTSSFAKTMQKEVFYFSSMILYSYFHK